MPPADVLRTACWSLRCRRTATSASHTSTPYARPAQLVRSGQGKGQVSASCSTMPNPVALSVCLLGRSWHRACFTAPSSDNAAALVHIRRSVQLAALQAHTAANLTYSCGDLQIPREVRGTVRSRLR